MDSNVYMICFPVTSNYKNDARYIESALPQQQLEDVLIGLEFYMEDHCEDIEFCGLAEDYAAYFLTEFFDCKNSTEQAWDEQGDERRVINLFTAREQRCGPGYKKYVDPILTFESTEFIQAYLAFCKSPSADYEKFSAEELIQKYREEHPDVL